MKKRSLTIITAGSTYLDIDAYACIVAMAQLRQLKGENAVAYSRAPYNYSVCASLVKDGQILQTLPSNASEESARYIIVDVSDPRFLADSVPLDRVVEVYDHHIGFEEYWTDRIGSGAHIEFIGAAATLIYRAWCAAGVQDKMPRETALLLLAAILDNTLNLTSSNTTDEDRETFADLCRQANVDDAWRGVYFSEVQKTVQADLHNALVKDVKRVGQHAVLPANVAQLCVWDADDILERLSDIRSWFDGLADGWMLNLIDIKHNCSYFVCDDFARQEKIERIFNVRFTAGVARSARPYLRKQLLKITSGRNDQ